MSDDLRIVEHEQDGVVTFYVATDLNPEEFPGAPTLGPFATRSEAETAAAEWESDIDAAEAADSTASDDAPASAE